jgi:hypothetical protein
LLDQSATGALDVTKRGAVVIENSDLPAVDLAEDQDLEKTSHDPSLFEPSLATMRVSTKEKTKSPGATSRLDS